MLLDYESLRTILEEECGEQFTLDDAKEIGDGLIRLYSALGGVVQF
ncbi:MAG TPA: hypothetical protein VFL85_03175 [Candidatus Saccharimonadales bacterium]|nr:hypothetical protein [Candidatus Saccharimonadales bacterium]